MCRRVSRHTEVRDLGDRTGEPQLFQFSIFGLVWNSKTSVFLREDSGGGGRRLLDE